MLVKIGTRGSSLAAAQALEAKRKLLESFPDLTAKIIEIKTSGDKHTNANLAEIGGKGLFLKEIETELLENNIDIAVHSLKDVPAFFSKDLIIPCVLERLSPCDAFISNKYNSLESLPKQATIATSSIRRKVQLLNFRPDLNIVPLRGNVATRLQNHNFDGIILAEAGLIRLKKHHLVTEVLPPKIMLSAVGQGAICIQCRKSDVKIIDLLEKINDNKSFIRVKSERSFMKTVNGSCFTPLAALAEYVNENMLHFRCMLADKKNIYFTERTSFVEDAEKMGMDAGLELKSKCL
ncbi:hydroxymethylbilane synthase [Wolbachia endosymbiont of Atemnus politus]|uniref:hydroxymethylbilane synthase n=1 Tax=Wolbachia endosymbiont of Atemnus politus TaxID=2682840 RepID=UPI001574C702|nr:hydroxymethylbilane synthase [Wolbachia endosymbiont of Atemnus politus]NSM56925.1 hydroxymethylbilane synthase [Wolbachia endosymbiont of Atemnus politus]NSX83614.1 hydroxymethylbilane synthase [Wolbachia endosymbiont of Atemnus politus]